MSMISKRPYDANPAEQHFTPTWCVEWLLANPFAARCFTGSAADRDRLWIDVGAGGLALSSALNAALGPQRWALVEPCCPELSASALMDWQPKAKQQTRLIQWPWVTDAETPRVTAECVREIGPRLLRNAAMVVSNPPFSLATAVVLAARDACPSAHVWLHQRLGWIDEARATLFTSLGMPDVYVLPRRVRYLTPSGDEQAPFPGLSAWYHWSPVLTGRSSGSIHWLEAPTQPAQLRML